MQVRWAVHEKGSERVVNRGRVDHMIVVQHKYQSVRPALEVVEQSIQGIVEHGVARFLKQQQRLTAKLRHAGLKRCDQVAPELLEIVILNIEREPGDIQLASLLHPLA